FHAALRFIDDFVDSAQTPADDRARARLRDLLPSLEKTLRHGLTTVAFQEPDLRRLLDDLHEFWRRQLGDEPASAAETAAAEATVAALLPIPAQVETILDEDPSDTPPATEAAISVDDLESVQAVRALKVGAWIEFVDEAGASERAKLSWISPISGKYLFVNRRGLKVADRTAVQLATELHDNRAMILEEVPLFDRALDAIVERLRQAQAERQGS